MDAQAKPKPVGTRQPRVVELLPNVCEGDIMYLVHKRSQKLHEERREDMIQSLKGMEEMRWMHPIGSGFI
jgi:hypothetical protein